MFSSIDNFSFPEQVGEMRLIAFISLHLVFLYIVNEEVYMRVEIRSDFDTIFLGIN